MTDDLTFEELPPGRYNGTVERVRYSFKAATHIVIAYRLDAERRTKQGAEQCALSRAIRDAEERGWRRATTVSVRGVRRPHLEGIRGRIGTAEAPLSSVLRPRRLSTS